MAKVAGFYQPVGDGNKITWLLWTSFLLVSPIWASEMLYSVNGLWLAYTILVLAVGAMLFFGRRFKIEDGQLTTRSFLKKKTVRFAGVQIIKRRLVINNEIEINIGKKKAEKVKDIIHG